MHYTDCRFLLRNLDVSSIPGELTFLVDRYLRVLADADRLVLDRHLYLGKSADVHLPNV
jgi:hypothetical protein